LVGATFQTHNLSAAGTFTSHGWLQHKIMTQHMI